MSHLLKLAATKQAAADARFQVIIHFLEQDSPDVPCEVLKEIAHMLKKACDDQNTAMMLAGERLLDIEQRLMHLSINSNSKN